MPEKFNSAVALGNTGKAAVFVKLRPDSIYWKLHLYEPTSYSDDGTMSPAVHIELNQYELRALRNFLNTITEDGTCKTTDQVN